VVWGTAVPVCHTPVGQSSRAVLVTVVVKLVVCAVKVIVAVVVRRISVHYICDALLAW